MDLIKFGYKGQFVTVIEGEDGNPWWVAKEVCNLLGLGNVGQAVTSLDDDEKNTIIINDGIPGNPNRLIINEPGLYSLILRSRNSEAKQFKRWITHEVLPSIRKTGVYKTENGPERLETSDSENYFKDGIEALGYIQASGLDIKKSKIYGDIQKGILVRERDGGLSMAAVEEYIRKHRESGLPKYSGDSNQISFKYSSVSKQQRDIKAILETAFKIAKILGHPNEDASLIAQAKVEELTGIRLSEIYTISSGQKQIEHFEPDCDEPIDDNLIEDFIDANCEIGNEFKTTLSILHRRFRDWYVCTIGENPPGKNDFSEYLSAVVDRTQHAGTIFHGIKLSDNKWKP